MPVDVLLGLQWGDEGKGKIVDLLSPEYDIIARFQGGPNAGHTLVVNKKKFIFHTLPSGIIRKNILNIIGSGMVVDPIVLNGEIGEIKKENLFHPENLLISQKAHLILPTHIDLDATYESCKGENKIGSTLKGIGPAYSDKMSRNGIRIGDIFSNEFKKKYKYLKNQHLQWIKHLNPEYRFNKKRENEWFKAIEYLRELQIRDTESFINKVLNENKQILAEGAQGSLLDTDFGTYPYVTSSNTVSGAACMGLGIPPQQIREVFGVFKAYTTRVGEGPFPTELSGKEAKMLRNRGKEFGATTGRPRRCGWLDLVALKYACQINGVTQLIVTKVDVLADMDEIKACEVYNTKEQKSISFSQGLFSADHLTIFKSFPGWKKDIFKTKDFNLFSQNFKSYVSYIENFLLVPVEIVSTGPERDQTVFRK